MIERLLKLKLYIKQALKDIGALDMYYDENNFVCLKKIIQVLKPLELGVKELSKDEATLLTSEGVFNFMFHKLRTLDNDLSQEMLNSLKIKRFAERRNKDIVSLMKYLQGSNISRDENYEDFYIQQKQLLLAKDMIKRVFSQPLCNSQPSTIPDTLETTSCISLVMEMQDSIDSVSSQLSTARPDTFLLLQNEFKLLEATETRTTKLKKLLRALMTIQPTSTCSERVFH